jgi:predicted acetyltransferase
MFERRASWWEHRLLADPEEFRFGGGPKIFAVLEVDGRPQAYAIYRLHVQFGNLGPETRIVPVEVLGASPAATASIWRYLLDVDWVRSVSARLLGVDHPLLLLLARLNLARPTISDGLWLRLVDVGQALSARSFAGDGPIVLQVEDAFCGWNEGRWSVGAGEAARTDADPDLALDVADLGSVYLGGFTFRELWRAGRVRELRTGALALADDLFRTETAPWCPEIF